MVADLTAILNSHFGSLNPEAREEAVAEAVALAWANYAGLLGKGKGHLATVHTLAYYAAKQVRQGRTIGSGSAKNDRAIWDRDLALGKPAQKHLTGSRHA